MLRNWLAHPSTLEFDIDDPRMTKLRQEIIRQNPFLFQIYESWYALLSAAIPGGDGRILELGSGGGFLPEFIPGAITSEIFFLNDVHVVLDGQRMPFPDASLKAVVMTNVLHHIPSARNFFSEAKRVVRPGGVISMIEPWASSWSKIIYTRLHHEPFDVDSPSWEFPSSGPLSGAHASMPWIIFHRDRMMFEQEFPEWQVERVTPFMPFAYLLSGGVSLRQLMPGWSYKLVRWFESALTPAMPKLAMFAHILLTRKPDN